MGIPGLTSYVAKNSEDFLRDYKLHNRPLVIDGHSIIYKLYEASDCDYSCGGDYSKYANVVTKFFLKLLQCKVSPIVLFDGGWEDKKICTIYNRLKANIKTASNPKLLKKQIILPMLAKDIFKFVAREKQIPLIQTIHEADDHIAGVAKSLQCPVLSSDSDFYIYDVEYIPYESLSPFITYSLEMEKLSEKLYIQCKIFKTEHWLSRFPQMDKRNLPLIAILLGNDEIDPIIFRQFFWTLKVPKTLAEEFSKDKTHLIIEATLHWLQNHSISSAVVEIMKKIEMEEHDSVKQAIETIMNGYILLPPTIDDILRQLPTEIKSLVVPVVVQPYSFRNLICLEDFDFEPINENESYLADCPKFRNAISSDGSTRISAPITNRDPIPDWLYERYTNALVPSDFINIMFRQTLMFGVCMEDFSLPPPIKMCFKIIGVIFEILNNRPNNHGDLKYISRGEGQEYLEVFIDTMPSTNFNFPCTIPALAELDRLNSSMKKQIFSITLDIDDQLLRRFPPSWRLYVATMKYWRCESTQTVTKCHIYALTISMVFNIVKKYHAFPAKKDEKLILQENSDHLQQRSKTSIMDSLMNLDADECLVTDKKLMTRASRIQCGKVDRRVIHTFSAFQLCFKNIRYLNALLDFPYSVDINQAEFFNGVLIYNFYHEFNGARRTRRHLMDTHVRDLFYQCPSVLRLFTSIILEITGLLQLT